MAVGTDVDLLAGDMWINVARAEAHLYIHMICVSDVHSIVLCMCVCVGWWGACV